MNEIKEKYLPIGTVVRLKGGSKRVMVIGFCCLADDNNEKVWDYMGCVYPEGVLTSKNTLMFDHNQIEEVGHMGLSDQEEVDFKKKLNDLMLEVEKQKNSSNSENSSNNENNNNN